MQRLEVSCAVRRIYTSLGAKGLTGPPSLQRPSTILRLTTSFNTRTYTQLQNTTTTANEKHT